MYFRSNKSSLGEHKRRQKHLADPKLLNSCVASGSQELVYLLFDLAGAVVLVGGSRHCFFLHHPHKTQLRLSVEWHCALGQLFDPHGMVSLGWQHVLVEARGGVLKLDWGNARSILLLPLLCLQYKQLTSLGFSKADFNILRAGCP